MNALRQTRMFKHWSATSTISARRPISASTPSIKLNLFEHQLSSTKPSVRCMTTARLREYLEPTRQKNANAVQIYKDVSNNIKQKREEARACHNLDLSVDLGCLQLECKLYLRKRIERAAREAPGNESSEFENLKTPVL
jgi:hypothetical protein